MTWKRTLSIGAAVVAGIVTVAWSGGMRDRSSMESPQRTDMASHFAWCDGAVERLEIMSAAGPVYLGLDDGQKAAWAALMTDLRKALASFEDGCMAAMTGRPAGPAPVRLASLRDQLSTGKAAIDQVRPSFDAFYRGLDADQKQRIEDMLARGRHR